MCTKEKVIESEWIDYGVFYGRTETDPEDGAVCLPRLLLLLLAVLPTMCSDPILYYSLALFS